MALPSGTLPEFRAFFPEFNPVPDVSVNVYLDLNIDFLDVVQWQDNLGLAILYRTAHELALSQNRQAGASTTDGFVTTASASGSLDSASAAEISASYTSSTTQTTGSDTDVYLAKTEYGQMYLALKRQSLSLGVRAKCQ